MDKRKQPHSDEHRKRISLSKLGHSVSEETRKKLREQRLGVKMGPNKNKTRPFSEETKQRMSLAKQKEKHPNWKGGISYEEYSINWTETLRRSIRERDKYVCRICGEMQGDIALDVHHIDYNKKNCDPDNLITLCHCCHSRTNWHNKEWTEYFQKLKFSY